MLNTHRHRLPGFTIVELLVVIVVIGVLAAITIVSYTGITAQAVATAMKADLSNANSQIMLFKSDKGIYPTSLAAVSGQYCLNSDPGYCFKATNGNSFSFPPGDGTSFTLDSVNGTTAYRISNLSSIPALVPPATPLTSIASITGTTQVGSTLTSGAVNPTGATVTYQWQSSTTSGGTYTNISGAASSTYALTSNELNKYLKVVVTGTGSYGGAVTSGASGVVTGASTVVTGGTVTYVDSNGLNPRSSPAYAGGYTVRTFTSSGTLTVTGGTISGASVLVVGGGGGGAAGGECPGGAGGAGGFVTGTQTLSGVMGVTVGGGGYSGWPDAAPGNNSSFGSLPVAGGGGRGACPGRDGEAAGGSGGGGGSNYHSGGSGTTGQGNSGGSGNDCGYGGGGGGGGAGAAGGNGSTASGGSGGVGRSSTITGTLTYYAGGGGGGSFYTPGVALGGAGGGGNGSYGYTSSTSGAANSGGGGGGGSANNFGLSDVGSWGGSGVVIIRYPNP